MRRRRHIDRTPHWSRCSAINAYLTLHPWQNEVTAGQIRGGFFRMSRSSVTRASSLQLADICILAVVARHRLRQLPLSGIQRMLTDAEPFGKFCYRIPKFGDQGHRITLELIAEIRPPVHRILSSKSGSKASGNLGATQPRAVRAIQTIPRQACDPSGAVHSARHAQSRTKVDTNREAPVSTHPMCYPVVPVSAVFNCHTSINTVSIKPMTGA